MRNKTTITHYSCFSGLCTDLHQDQMLELQPGVYKSGPNGTGNNHDKNIAFKFHI